MLIVKCDRCGAEEQIPNIFPTYSCYSPEEVEQPEKKKLPKYMITKTEGSGDVFCSAWSSLYLCENCETAFDEFLKELK